MQLASKIWHRLVYQMRHACIETFTIAHTKHIYMTSTSLPIKWWYDAISTWAMTPSSSHTCIDRCRQSCSNNTHVASIRWEIFNTCLRVHCIHSICSSVCNFFISVLLIFKHVHLHTRLTLSLTLNLSTIRPSKSCSIFTSSSFSFVRNWSFGEVGEFGVPNVGLAIPPCNK